MVMVLPLTCASDRQGSFFVQTKTCVKELSVNRAFSAVTKPAELYTPVDLCNPQRVVNPVGSTQLVARLGWLDLPPRWYAIPVAS
jgi:hypothetical protein